MLEERSLQLVLANPVGSVMEKLHQSEMLDSFGLNGIYLAVGEAVADISALWKSKPDFPKDYNETRPCIETKR
ncbi:hypothetical protein OIU78_010527 [Salix suchowensis]|nr:hypothetical protein OIU78_010527 [Salix suchowensis]